MHKVITVLRITYGFSTFPYALFPCSTKIRTLQTQCPCYSTQFAVHSKNGLLQNKCGHYTEIKTERERERESEKEREVGIPISFKVEVTIGHVRVFICS